MGMTPHIPADMDWGGGAQGRKKQVKWSDSCWPGHVKCIFSAVGTRGFLFKEKHFTERGIFELSKLLEVV